jgi:hypothetical protein
MITTGTEIPSHSLGVRGLPVLALVTLGAALVIAKDQPVTERGTAVLLLPSKGHRMVEGSLL